VSKRKTIADRLRELREGREDAVPVPVTGRETAAERARQPGFAGRAARVREMIGQRVGHVSAFEAAASPFEHLVAMELLLLDKESTLSQREKLQLIEIRAEAGFKFRAERELEAISGLGAKPLVKVGGGGPGLQLADVKLSAMQSLGRLRKTMDTALFRTLELVVAEDVWTFEIPRPEKFRDKAHRHTWHRRASRKRRAVIGELCAALDKAAGHYGLQTQQGSK
jgi:hypothetical protein